MAKVNVKNVLAYLIGNYRYRLYYSVYFGFLMRAHIREQIDARINSMDPKCFNDGACKSCGCRTTHLQMANKTCDETCYPEMQNKYRWLTLKQGFSLKINNFTWVLQEDKFVKRHE